MKKYLTVLVTVAIAVGLVSMGIPAFAADAPPVKAADKCCKAADKCCKASDKAAAKCCDKDAKCKVCGKAGCKGCCKDTSAAKTPKNLKIGGSVEVRTGVKK
jgi:hypothetical protein